jgi:hypothetical protein
LCARVVTLDIKNGDFALNYDFGRHAKC